MDEVKHHSSFATSYYKPADTNEIGYKYHDHDQEPVLIYHKQQKTIQENNEIHHKYSNINADQWTTKENRYIKSFIICMLSTTCFHSFIMVQVQDMFNSFCFAI